MHCIIFLLIWTIFIPLQDADEIFKVLQYGDKKSNFR